MFNFRTNNFYLAEENRHFTTSISFRKQQQERQSTSNKTPSKSKREILCFRDPYLGLLVLHHVQILIHFLAFRVQRHFFELKSLTGCLLFIKLLFKILFERQENITLQYNKSFVPKLTQHRHCLKHRQLPQTGFVFVHGPIFFYK